MRRFFAQHHNLVLAICFFVAATWLSLHLSAAADRRQHREIAFQHQWRLEEAAWQDSDAVRSARNDSLLKAMIDSLEAMHKRAMHQRADVLLELRRIPTGGPR